MIRLDSRARFRAAVVVSFLWLSAWPAAAEDRSDSSSFLHAVLKGVALDPTTYAPALIAYDATKRDWDSSQVFFEHGYLESNSRYTVSGRAFDVPVGYGEGNRRIFTDALTSLGWSAFNNASSRATERLLMKLSPRHRRTIKTIGWIERTALASYTAYVLSATHYRQWRTNVQLAGQLGY